MWSCEKIRKNCDSEEANSSIKKRRNLTLFDENGRFKNINQLILIDLEPHIFYKNTFNFAFALCRITIKLVSQENALIRVELHNKHALTNNLFAELSQKATEAHLEYEIHESFYTKDFSCRKDLASIETFLPLLDDLFTNCYTSYEGQPMTLQDAFQESYETFKSQQLKSTKSSQP